MAATTPTTEKTMTIETYKYAAPKSDITESVETAREHYAHVLECAKWHGITADALKAAAAKKNPTTPLTWVTAAIAVTNECDRCRGGGVYYWGAVVNGKPTKSGQCFHCGGKGRQNHADRKRCIDYIHFGIKVYG